MASRRAALPVACPGPSQLEAGPRWAPITLDPIATRVEVLEGVAYLLAFVTALRVARRKDGVTFLSGVIVATALALAAVLHPAFGERNLDGIYDPVAHSHSLERGISKPSKLAGRKVSASASESAMA
jgi:hypothetical protein